MYTSLLFKPPLLVLPAVTQFCFQMSFPSTLKPTDKLEQKQINLNGKAVTILFIYRRKKGSKQQKEIIDELAILLSVIIGAPSKKSNWIYLD